MHLCVNHSLTAGDSCPAIDSATHGYPPLREAAIASTTPTRFRQLLLEPTAASRQPVPSGRTLRTSVIGGTKVRRVATLRMRGGVSAGWRAGAIILLAPADVIGSGDMMRRAPGDLTRQL